MKKTNIIPGACFGYFDETFGDCRRCRISGSCYRATHSDAAQAVRAIAKTTCAQVDELTRKWLPKSAAPLGPQQEARAEQNELLDDDRDS